jgi:type VI secretion system protein ImpE
MAPEELFRAGDLKGALAAQTEAVRARPADAGRRTFLFELLAFAGELDRAEKQLDALATQTADAEWAVQVYRNILHAERIRRRVFAEGLAPQFLLDPPAYMARYVQACAHVARSEFAACREELDQAEAQRAPLSAVINGQACEDVRDGDDLLAPVLELIIQRDYIWLPLEQVRALQVLKPERARDLIWAAVRLELVDGSHRSGYTPVLYPGTHELADDRLRLGKLTNWRTLDGGITLGMGAHTLLFGGPEAGGPSESSSDVAAGAQAPPAGEGMVGLLDCREVVFGPQAG